MQGEAAHHQGVVIPGPVPDDWRRVLDGEALSFVADLARRFSPRIDALLARRSERRAAWRAGESLDFPAETEEVRRSDWKVPPVPPDLTRRIVEITGPVDRKAVINAMNSGADTYMADFEDSTSPSWENVVQGQRNLIDAVRHRIRHVDPRTGRRYQLEGRTATLIVRPRGLHLTEDHVLVDGRPVPASLFDFGLYFFHNVRQLVEQGSGPYFYLAKLESHLEARLWNDVFRHAQAALRLPRGTIKATVLIETLPAAFEMDEILHALREHSAGLNCGRWDYIFSFIKAHRWHADALLPDRSQVTMDQPFMRAYTRLAVRTCHRRGVHCIGGMAAQIPIKSDPSANRAALEQVRADKLREVREGHDGTWVAHPDLVPIARLAFTDRMNGPHQLDRLREDVHVTAFDLLRVPTGTRTEDGLRLNVRVGIRYLEAWLRGIGCVALYHLMEDAATAEISRAQVWQWIEHGARLEDGRVITRELVDGVIEQEMRRIAGEVGRHGFQQGRYRDARDLFRDLCFAADLPESLTGYAYGKMAISAVESRSFVG